MNEYVPLDHLVLNLLALAEAAPELPPEARERLARLAEEVEPTVDALARIGLRIRTELLGYPAFDQARAAWEALRPERYGLDLGAINEDLTNPERRRPDGPQPPEWEFDPWEVLAQTVRQAVQDPQGFARQTALLQRLAGWLRLPWPRR